MRKALAAVALAASGCTAVLGDDFQLGDGTGGSGTGGSGTGGVLEPIGEHVWSMRFGDGVGQSVHAVAVTPFGDVLVGGSFSGEIALPNIALSAWGLRDAFVLKLAADGTPVWGRSYGYTGGSASVNALAVDSTGAIYMAGTYDGGIEFGPGPMMSDGDDAFFVKLTASGAYDSLWFISGPGPQSGRALAVAPDDTVYIAGNYSGEVHIGGATLTNPAAQAIFVGFVGASGSFEATETFGSMGWAGATAITVDSQSNAWLGGAFDYILAFDQSLNSGGGKDMFLAKLDSALVPSWSSAFGTSGEDDVGALAAGATGGFALAGYASGPIDLGHGSMAGGGGRDAVVGSYGSNGAARFTHEAGDAADQSLYAAAVRADGVVFAGGTLAGSADFGLGTLTSAGGASDDDALLVAFAADGTPRWSARAGDTAPQSIAALAPTPDGGIVAAGSFQGTVDFGGEPLTSAGDVDGFVVKLH
ncbi:MAG: hypothetical protein IT373_21210 [Polyangiaceae bacterium]|nr:hypothetical protein [Polyangiaceae bacterium]